MQNKTSASNQCMFDGWIEPPKDRFDEAAWTAAFVLSACLSLGGDFCFKVVVLVPVFDRTALCERVSALYSHWLLVIDGHAQDMGRGVPQNGLRLRYSIILLFSRS